MGLGVEGLIPSDFRSFFSDKFKCMIFIFVLYIAWYFSFFLYIQQRYKETQLAFDGSVSQATVPLYDYVRISSPVYWTTFGVGRSFTVELWVRVTATVATEDPAIISSKNWHEVCSPRRPTCGGWGAGVSKGLTCQATKDWKIPLLTSLLYHKKCAQNSDNSNSIVPKQLVAGLLPRFDSDSSFWRPFPGDGKGKAIPGRGLVGVQPVGVKLSQT